MRNGDFTIANLPQWIDCGVGVHGCALDPPGALNATAQHIGLGIPSETRNLRLPN